MKRKTANLKIPEQGLFDLDEPSVVLAQVKTAQLIMLVETLLHRDRRRARSRGGRR